ncbi:MAG: hypothetical protein OK438_04730 [Thaumarchaeota archaeon]|nr:hypothetical protein [Nitrososphaerota archaeon]
MSIPTQLQPFLNTVPEWALLLSLLLVSLALAFAGRRVVKVLAFLLVGLIGASVGGILAAQYLAGALGTSIGALVGFLLGGLIGLLLIRLGIGLAIGYAAYVLTTTFVSGNTIPLIVGFVFFIIGAAFYNRILGFITAVAGGLLFFDVLTLYGLGSTRSIVLAVVLTLAGIWVQERPGRRKSSQQASAPAPTGT